jgi:dephospho-CoA kinase
LVLKRIALTGPSGAGKGYVATLLCQKGIAYLDTDHLVHTLYQGGKLPDLIAARFGSAVMGEDGSVNRPMLSQIVFSDKQALRDLNAIVHTEVEQQVQVWLKDKESEGYAAALVDAPQLFEAGMEKDFDLVVGVVADKAQRLARICLRDGIDRQRAEMRLRNQKSEDEYRALCDFVITNNVNSDLTKQIDELSKMIFNQ